MTDGHETTPAQVDTVGVKGSIIRETSLEDFRSSLEHPQVGEPIQQRHEFVSNREFYGYVREKTMEYSRILSSLNSDPLLVHQVAARLAVATGQDVFGHVAEAKKLKQRLEHDSLTGALNRDGFIAYIQENNHSGSILFIDLRGFKIVNDAYSHKRGDEVLVEAARRLTDTIRPRDAVARVGGDEFIVYAEGVETPEDLEAVKRRVAQAFELPFSVGNNEVRLGVGIGVGAFNSENSIEKALADADEDQNRAREEYYRAHPELPQR